MEKDHSLSQRKNAGKSKGMLSPEKARAEREKQKEKNMVQCLTGAVNILSTIANTLEEAMNSHLVHSNFSLSNMMEI